MSVIHAPKKQELDARLLAFPIVMAILLLILFFRMWYFQVVKSPELIERANASREMKVSEDAPRGLIFDRNGVMLAGVRPEVVVTAVPAEVEKAPWVLDKVAAILGVEVSKLQSKVKAQAFRKLLPCPIFVGASVEAGSRIAEAGEDLPGIEVETRPMRYYTDTKSLSHVLGYVWLPSEKDVTRLEEKGLQPATYVGKLGIERSYEGALMGSPGVKRIEIDARGRPVHVVGRDNSLPGKQLILTLDSKLQQIAANSLTASGFRGGAVAIDPSNGEILCLVSSPTYDQSMFLGGISTADWKSLNEDESRPMVNRPAQSAYAPGSTFKMVTTLAAYEAGEFNPSRTFFCNGGFKLGDHTFKCLGHHGVVNFKRALEKSCNVYFANLGHLVGRAGILKAAEEVGLGVPTGVELAGETGGDLPNEKWLKRNRKPARWVGGDAINSSIGQGAVNVTALQMANVMALIANNGTSYVPHLVREIRDGKNREAPIQVKPIVAHHVGAPEGLWSTIKDALVGVIEEGTGKPAQIPGLVWGGKTGSAEHDNTKNSHAWFVGIAPIDNPKICVAVMVESGGHGSAAAAPVVKALVESYLASSASKMATASSALVASASSRKVR